MASFQKLINDSKPVLIDFHATWCGPCKMLEPTIKEVKQEVGDSIKVIKVDIDKNKTLSRKLNVQGVPTLMLFRDGNKLWQQSGVMSFTDILNVLNSLIEISA